MNKDTPQQLLLGFQLDGSATLGNFQASAADLQLMQHLKDKVIAGQEPLTFFWGKPEVGKTHLLQALCHELTSIGGTSIYLPLSHASHADQIAPDMLQGLEHLDLICLDDVNGIAGQADWEQALFTFYNQARNEGARLVITAEKPPAELAIHLPDLHSRLQSGVVYQLHELSDSEKTELLSHRARILGVELPKSVIDYVLQRHDRRVSALVLLLQELDKLSLEQKRPITIPLVKQLMNW